MRKFDRFLEGRMDIAGQKKPRKLQATAHHRRPAEADSNSPGKISSLPFRVPLTDGDSKSKN